MSIRPMNADDVPRGMTLKDQAGWNQTPADWQRLLALQPEGCFVAEWDGRVVGTTCVTCFGPVGWISMVLVDLRYRGRGVGTRLMEHALAHLDGERIRTVRLDATPLGQPVYARLGFTAEYEMVRWEGTVEAGRLDAGIMCAAQEQLDAIAELDRQATGTPRRRLLERLHREQPDAMRIAVADGRIAGYSHFRLGSRARQIGPVIALDAPSGEVLLDGVLHDAAGQPIYLDVPLVNQAAMRWAGSRGLGIQRQFVRMFRGEPVVDCPERIWASFGPEKG
jgi:GNAT superfamily N-acetyltransferase